METALINVAKETLNKPKVKGYLCADNKGLCIYANGINSCFSGIISSIAASAKQLDTECNPIIELETDKGKILIQGKETIVTAIYKLK